MFRPTRIAVFIDGCYWHGCPSHYVPPLTNREYWGPKVAGNVERDRDTDRALASAGWTVLRYWEHEDPEAVADAIEDMVRSRRRMG